MWWTNAENFKNISWFLFDLELKDWKFVATNDPLVLNFNKVQQQGAIGQVTSWKEFSIALKKMAFWIFLPSQGVHLNDVHALSKPNSERILTQLLQYHIWGLLCVEISSKSNRGNLSNQTFSIFLFSKSCSFSILDQLPLLTAAPYPLRGVQGCPKVALRVVGWPLKAAEKPPISA